MKPRSTAGLALSVALISCGPQREPRQPVNNATAPVLPAPSAPPAVKNEAAALPEPKVPIDPTSAEAAGQVVQHYGALIEQGRWREGWTLWTDAAAAKSFERSFRTWSDVHLEIGSPGDMEGAAGSIYVTVPANFYGHLKSGQQSRLTANAILRRVNDVPGSTAEQRRWHIERIDSAH
jgi:hypothetical protein